MKLIDLYFPPNIERQKLDVKILQNVRRVSGFVKVGDRASSEAENVLIEVECETLREECGSLSTSLGKLAASK